MPLETFTPIKINNDVYKSNQISEDNDISASVLEDDHTNDVLIEEEKLNDQEDSSEDLNPISLETSDEKQSDELRGAIKEINTLKQELFEIKRLIKEIKN